MTLPANLRLLLFVCCSPVAFLRNIMNFIFSPPFFPTGRNISLSVTLHLLFPSLTSSKQSNHMLSQTATNPDEPRPLHRKATRLKQAEDAERMDSQLIQNFINFRSRTLSPWRSGRQSGGRERETGFCLQRAQKAAKLGFQKYS